jgi:putative phosphoesterase
VTQRLEVVVLADTHMQPGRSTVLPPRVVDALSTCDLILHAGDVLTVEVLDELATLAPVHAVLGNNDHTLVGKLPDRLEVDLAGVRIGMVHDSGGPNGRSRRLRRWFPDAAIVVFGHSHEPVDVEGDEGQRLFNPGSPTQRRRQPHPTMGRLTLHDGQIEAHRIVRVDDAG